MGKSSKTLNDRLHSLLLEYLKDSNRSDRELAKILGVSQPTISRMKNKLLTDGIVRHFSAIPDFAKMGYELMAFSMVKFNMTQMKEIEMSADEWAKSRPEIIFTARAEGIGIDAITISVHKNYAEYTKFITENKRAGGNFMDEMHFVLVDLKKGVTKPLSFESLAKRKKS